MLFQDNQYPDLWFARRALCPSCCIAGCGFDDRHAWEMVVHFEPNALALARAGAESSNEATDTQDETKH
jgi:hypothetical protein